MYLQQFHMAILCLNFILIISDLQCSSKAAMKQFTKQHSTLLYLTSFATEKSHKYTSRQL